MAFSRKILKKFFVDNNAGPVKAKQVARALGIHENEYHSLREVLREMVEEGVLRRIRKNAFTLAEGGDTVTGRLQIVRKGFGFVIPDSGGKDLFIRSSNLGGGFDGDRVEARVVGRSRKLSPEGEVSRVISRSRRRFTGILRKRKGFSSVEPLEEKVPTDFLIPGKGAARLKNGRKVLIEVFDWGAPGGKPLAKILRTLGEPGANPEEEIVLKYELPEKFPALVLRQGEELARDPSAEDLNGRQDFRSLAAFTIDPPDAQDFDDALSVRALPEGEVEVGVHIADVSYFVREGGALDKEARERATSVYLNETYLPMLPEALSSGVCSLLPGRDRLALSVCLRLDREGELQRSRFVRSVIRSSHRFDYSRAQRVIDGEPGAGESVPRAVIEALRLLAVLSEKRKLQRSRRGQIDFDLPEPLVVRNSAGDPVEIVHKPRLASHRLVEEFMISANELVASRLSRSRLPGVFRIHEPPDPEAVNVLNYQLRALDPGLNIEPGEDPLSPLTFSRLIQRAESLGFGDIVSLIVVQSLKRAIYSVENIGHFGLASDCYTHFTSPIRRYPDLLVHRLLIRTLGSERSGESSVETLEDSLAEACAYCSRRELLIDEASRESDNLMQARLMKRHIGEIFDAVITSVKPHGFAIRLKNVLVEGFIPVSRLQDDYYRIDEEQARLIGDNRGTIFRLGQAVRVILRDSDPDTRKLDFIPEGLNARVHPEPEKIKKGAGR